MRIRSELERIAPTESVKLLTQYVAADAEDWEARRALANAELALGKGSEALRDIQDCLDTHSDDIRLWLDQLTMLQSLGELEAFSDLLRRVPNRAETAPEFWIIRAQTQERAGDWAAAAGDYRRALSLDPNLPGAHYRLATIEARLGNAVEASAHRKRWQALTKARTELRQAFALFVDVQQRLPSDSPELSASIQRLASICRTLGWTRDAEAWSQLAVRSLAGMSLTQ
jgi:tetratricopeptide (TPR) repeat protein